MTQRLYRLTVAKWPTPDGKPFDRQPHEFWESVSDAFHNPTAGRSQWPDWLGDISDWFDDPGGPWEPQHRAWKSGAHVESAGLVVPVVSRRHWQTQAAAERRAAVLRLWGCTVRVDASDLITWTEAGEPS